MVAKSFQSFEVLTEVYEVSGKKYVRVRNPKTGTERQVLCLQNKHHQVQERSCRQYHKLRRPENI